MHIKEVGCAGEKEKFKRSRHEIAACNSANKEKECGLKKSYYYCCENIEGNEESTEKGGKWCEMFQAFSFQE